MSTTEQKALELAEAYAQANATFHLESLYGTSKTYTAEKQREALEAQDKLFAELRRLSAENEALRNQSEDRRAQIERMSGYIHTCGPNCSKADCVNARLSAENAELATQFATRDAELATLRAQTLNAEAELASEALRNDNLRRMIRGYQDELTGLRAQVEAPNKLTEPTWDATKLAEMVLSDCGCSTDHTRLLERVSARIEVHVQDRIKRMQSLTRPAVKNDFIADPPAIGQTAPDDALMHWRDGAKFALEAVARVDSLCWLTDSMRDVCLKLAAEAVIAERKKRAAAPQPEVQPYSLDADPQGIRQLAAHAITGALAYGTRGTNPPPEGHWLAEFWTMARDTAAPQPIEQAMRNVEWKPNSSKQKALTKATEAASQWIKENKDAD